MKLKLAISGIVAALLATTSVQALPISGTISMGGEATLNTGSLNNATSVSGWPLVYVVADSGSFSGISAYTLVNMATTTWDFSPAPGAQLPDLWNVGGFTFDFLGDTITQSGNFLDITGSGTISGNGYDTTKFTWTLGAEEPTTGGKMQFTFSANCQGTTGSQAVPDSGLTVALLGVALAGIELLRRKLIKA